MSLKRYSKSGVIETLNVWIAMVEKYGMYSKFNHIFYDLHSVDAGMVFAARSLVDDIKLVGHKGLLKKQFRALVLQRRDSAITLPNNKHLFTENTGYVQLRENPKEICFDYGKWNFDSQVVYSIFSEIL